MSLAEASLDYLNGRGTPIAYFRRLAEHSGWATVGVPREGGRPLTLLDEQEGGRTLLAFSDDRALERFQASDRFPADAFPLGGVHGCFLFGNLPGMVEQVQLDPGTPLAVLISGERLELLREMGRAVQVERALADPRDGAAFVEALRWHRGYRILLQKGPDGPQLLRTADASGKVHALVFTAQDCAEEFLATAPPEMRAGIEPRRLAAEELFTTLPKTGLAGILFNPGGPAKATSWKMDICGVVMGQKQDGAAGTN